MKLFAYLLTTVFCFNASASDVVFELTSEKPILIHADLKLDPDPRKDTYINGPWFLLGPRIENQTNKTLVVAYYEIYASTELNSNGDKYETTYITNAGNYDDIYDFDGDGNFKEPRSVMAKVEPGLTFLDEASIYIQQIGFKTRLELIYDLKITAHGWLIDEDGNTERFRQSIETVTR